MRRDCIERWSSLVRDALGEAWLSRVVYSTAAFWDAHARARRLAEFAGASDIEVRNYARTAPRTFLGKPVGEPCWTIERAPRRTSLPFSIGRSESASVSWGSHTIPSCWRGRARPAGWRLRQARASKSLPRAALHRSVDMHCVPDRGVSIRYAAIWTLVRSSQVSLKFCPGRSQLLVDSFTSVVCAWMKMLRVA